MTRLRAQRDNNRVREALARLTQVARTDPDDTDENNLLHAAVDAARARATIGEISDAMEAAFGRHKGSERHVSGVYGGELQGQDRFEAARDRVREFARHEGRQPRILVAKLGQDGHDRGARVIATGFADLGFDVDIGPLFQTPQEVVRQAIENDVHVLGISSLAAAHRTLLPDVMNELDARGRRDIPVIVGGVIPPDDVPFLFDLGVAGVFGPGTILSDAAIRILDLLQPAGT